MSLENIFKKSKLFVATSILTVLGLAASAQGRNSSEVEVLGYGTDLVRTEAGVPIEGVGATWRMLEQEGDSLFNYQFGPTNSSGTYDYEVTAFWELHVNINDNIQKQVVEVRPNPSADFTFNFLTDQGVLYISDMKGNIVDKQPPTNSVNKIATYYTNLSDEPDGIYFYTLRTPEKTFQGKLVKNGNNTVGKLAGIVSTHKNTRTTYEATYEITYEKEDYITLIDTVTIQEGSNTIMVHKMEEEGSNIPQYQWITGYTEKMNGAGLAIPIVRMYDFNTDELIEEISSNNSGFFEFSEPVNAGKKIYFKVGGDENYRSYDLDISGEFYQIPLIIEEEIDTITNSILFPMIENTGTPASKIRSMSFGDGNIEPTYPFGHGHLA